jgi:hypothetical protein
LGVEVGRERVFGFLAGVCQVVEEVREVVKGQVGVGGVGFQRLDPQVVIAEVNAVCLLHGWDGERGGMGVYVSCSGGGSIWAASCWRARSPVMSSVVRKYRSK